MAGQLPIPDNRPALPSFRAADRHPPSPLTVLPAGPYRHSRVSGNPAAAGRQRAGLFSTVRDSRLRGNDGCYIQLP